MTRHNLSKSRYARYCETRFPLTGVVLSGGVACNGVLRQQLEELAGAHGLQTFAPPLSLCVDNGVMIAWNGAERLLSGEVSGG